MGIPTYRQRHGQKQKEPSTELGEMSPQRNQSNQRDYVREASKKRDLIEFERSITPCDQIEMPKDDHGMDQYNQRGVSA